MAKGLDRVQEVMGEEFKDHNLISVSYDRKKERLRWISNSDHETTINVLQSVIDQLRKDPRPLNTTLN